MESQELERELEMQQIHTPLIEAGAAGNHDADGPAPREQEAQIQGSAAREVKEYEAQTTEPRDLGGNEANARPTEAQDKEMENTGSQTFEDGAVATQASGSSGEEDETQLGAIRELMERAFARGVWLALSEIAEVTEFAEASISAQLRHLRKPRHGRHRVEKRRRRASRRGKNCEGRGAAVIWEYRVLPKRSRVAIRGRRTRGSQGERAHMTR